jgi:hypothetical protein
MRSICLRSSPVSMKPRMSLDRFEDKPKAHPQCIIARPSFITKSKDWECIVLVSDAGTGHNGPKMGAAGGYLNPTAYVHCRLHCRFKRIGNAKHRLI